MMATKKKAKRKSLYPVIHIVAKEIWGDDREPYEQLLRSYYGAASSTELSYREKLDFIDRLKAIRDGKPQPAINRRRGPWASRDQIDKIGGLTGLLGWTGSKRLTGFIRRQTGKNKTKWMVTGPEGTKIIVGLQRILSGGNKKLYNFLNGAAAGELTARAWQQQLKRFAQ